MEGHFSLQTPNANNTLGAALIGGFGSAVLFGVTCLQGYLYYHRFPRDTLLHKLSVAFLWITDGIHLGITMHAVYFYLVNNFGNKFALELVVWSLKLQVVINVVIILLVQSLYAYRVWLLGGYHHGFLGYIVALAVLGGFGIGIALAYEIYQVDTFDELQKVSWAIIASLGASTTIDFVIAGAMCYYLSKSKGESKIDPQLNSRISYVMQYTLSSGLLTSACSLSSLFTYALMPNNFIFLALEFLLTKLYVGSFLAMLNARKRRRPSDLTHTGMSSGNSAHVQSVQFRILTTVETDRTPAEPSPGTTTTDGSTIYASFDERSKPWDVEASSTVSSPDSAVLPMHDLTYVQQDRQREKVTHQYMARW